MPIVLSDPILIFLRIVEGFRSSEIVYISGKFYLILCGGISLIDWSSLGALKSTRVVI